MNFKDSTWENTKAKSFYPRQQSGQTNYWNKNLGKIKNANIYDYQQPFSKHDSYNPEQHYEQNYHYEYSENSYVNFGGSSSAPGNALNKNAPAFKMKDYSTPQKTDYEGYDQYELQGKRLFENLSE